MPVDVRRLLGLKPHDRVAFIIDRDYVRIERASSVIERTAAALRSTAAPRSAEQLRELAERAIADDVREWTHLYVGTNLSFADACHAVLARRLGITEIVSSDPIPGATHVEP